MDCARSRALSVPRALPRGIALGMSLGHVPGADSLKLQFRMVQVCIAAADCSTQTYVMGS